MLTVHHLNNSRSQRVLWLLEELELPYEVVRYQRDEKTMLAPRELLAVHPLGKSPVITDDGHAEHHRHATDHRHAQQHRPWGPDPVRERLRHQGRGRPADPGPVRTAER